MAVLCVAYPRKKISFRATHCILYFIFNGFRDYSYSSRFCLSKSLVIRDWPKSVGEVIRLVEARRKELRLVEIFGDASIKVRLTAQSVS